MSLCRPNSKTAWATPLVSGDRYACQTFRNLLIFRDTEDSNRCLEMFLVNSWGEHLRQHERVTKADRELEERIRGYTLKEPTVRHLIYAAPP
jgi:hypothetical protein